MGEVWVGNEGRMKTWKREREGEWEGERGKGDERR